MTEAETPLPCLLLLIGHAHVVKAHFARHGLLEDFFQCRRRLVRAVAGRGAAVDLRRPVLVVAHGELGAGTRLELRQRGKRHHLAPVVAHVELPEVLQIRPVRRFGLHVHLPRTAEIVEVVDEQPAHESLNGPVNVADGHALLQHFVPVDIHELLRHARQKRGGDRANFGTLASGRQELVQVVCQELNVPPGTVFEHELKSAGSADSRDRRRREAESGSFRKLAELLVQARLDFLILFRSGLAVAPGLQRDEKEGVVTGPDKAEQAEADNARGVFDAGRVGEDLLNLSRRCAGALQRSRIRKLHVDVDVALVFIGQEARWHAAAKENSGKAEGRKHHQRQRALPNQPAGQPDIAVRGALENAIEPVKELSRAARGFPSLAAAAARRAPGSA